MWKEPPTEELEPDQLREHFLDMASRIEAHPEVEAVALARTAEAHVFMEDFATALWRWMTGTRQKSAFNAVTPGYWRCWRFPRDRGQGIPRTRMCRVHLRWRW